MSNEEATALTGYCEPEKAYNSLLDLAIPKIVMKMGKRGCLIVDEGTVRQVPVFATRKIFLGIFVLGSMPASKETQPFFRRTAAIMCSAAAAASSSRKL